MTTIHNTHVAQYTAWMKVDALSFDLDMYQRLKDMYGEHILQIDASHYHSGGILRIPLVSFNIASEINALPEATVTVATGLDITSPSFVRSPAHGLMEDQVITKGDYIHAEIMFRNVATDQTTCVFDGFISGLNFIQGVAGLQLMFSLVHWGHALNMCPVICSSLTTEGAESYSATFLHRMIAADSGANSTGPSGGGGLINWASTVQLTVQGLRGPLGGQVVPTIFRPILEKLHEGNVTESPKIKGTKGEFVPHVKNLPAGYTILDILGSASDSNSFSVPAVQRANIPDLVLRQDRGVLSKAAESASKTLRGALIDDIMDGFKGMKIWHGTAWSFLQAWAQLFDLTIVPRVHEICLIPTWEVIPRGKIAPLNLMHVVSMGGQRNTVHPSAALIAVPSDECPNVVRSQRFYWFSQAFGDSRRGTYVHPDKHTGPVGIAKMPRTLSGFLSAPDPHTRKVGDVYAETEFWRRQYMGSFARVLSPIRFDFCPGSTVAFNTGANAFTEMSSVGQVQRIEWSFHPSQGAMCSFQAGFVRSATSDEGSTEHLYYTSEPFSHAPWISNDQFKTFTDA